MVCCYDLSPAELCTEESRYCQPGRHDHPQGHLVLKSRPHGPSHPNQEGVGLAGGFIEGVIQFREGSPDGPIIATGFCEIVDLSTPMADGNDPSLGPAITRTLPERPDLPWRPSGPRPTAGG
jgi:hypothetical protein